MIITQIAVLTGLSLVFGVGLIILGEVFFPNNAEAHTTRGNLQVSCQVVRTDQPSKKAVVYKNKNETVIEYYYNF